MKTFITVKLGKKEVFLYLVSCFSLQGQCFYCLLQHLLYKWLHSLQWSNKFIFKFKAELVQIKTFQTHQCKIYPFENLYP